MKINERKALLAMLLAAFIGCSPAPYRKTEIVPIASGPKIAKSLMVGLIVDNRFPFWPRKESSPPVLKDGEKMVKDFEPLPVTKEVRAPMGEVRSRLANALVVSRRFDEIINPPGALIGDSLPEMLKKAMESSDYLLVGEVNAFHTKNIGLNKVSYFTLPFDVVLLGPFNCVVLLLTGGRSLLLTGGVFPAYTGESLFSMSLTVYSVETGRALSTFRIEERALSPVDNIAIYGDLNNPEDDWIDYGRRLAEVALTNACNSAVDKITATIEKDLRRKER